MMPAVLSAGLSFSLFTVLLSGASAQFLSRHPYLQMATQSAVTIVWRTIGPTTPVVRYGPAPDDLFNTALSVHTVVRLGPDVEGPAALPRLHSAEPWTFQYETSIFGLPAGTTLYYGVFDDDVLLAGGDMEHRFTTLPHPGVAQPLRLWVTGDTGEGSESQIAGFEAMREYVAAEGRPVDAYMHLGDMAYESGFDEEFSANFFQIYTEMLRNTVVWPTMGNHEGFTSSGLTQIGPYYDSYAVPTQGEAGGAPSGTEAYYSFDIGNAHFICLNSYDLDRSPSGEMMLWLKADLEMTNAGWLIAFWHHPPYTKGTHDSDLEIELIEMREFVMPVLESAGVDLVLTGHSHIYERSMLIDGAYATPTTSDGVVFDDGDGHPAGDGAYRKSAFLNPNEGTVAVVAGNGEGAGRSRNVSPVMRSVIGEVGSVILDIDADVLTLKMINRDAVVRDEFQLIKRGVVAQEVVEIPWQHVGPKYVVERLEPGATQVEMFPVPAAPDAVLHYTADGSEPTMASPIYSGPVAVPDTGSVRGFSVWRGGERQGLIADSSPLAPEFSIHRYPSAGSDDGYEDIVGNVFLDGDTVDIGNNGVAALRFTDVRIPPGAYLVRALVQFHKTGTQRMPTEGTIHAERVTNSQAFNSGSYNLSKRRKTTASADWIIRTWSGSAVRDLNTITPDLCEVVGEVIAQPGWRSGNAMSFFFKHAGKGRSAGAFESGKERAATLSVIFIDPEGLGEFLASQSPEIERDRFGRHTLMMRWPGSVVAEALGLSFQIEASPDLVRWDPVVTLVQGVTAPGADGYGELFAEFGPQLLAGKREFHFRVRVTQTQK